MTRLKTSIDYTRIQVSIQIHRQHLTTQLELYHDDYSLSSSSLEPPCANGSQGRPGGVPPDANGTVHDVIEVASYSPQSLCTARLTLRVQDVCQLQRDKPLPHDWLICNVYQPPYLGSQPEWSSQVWGCGVAYEGEVDKPHFSLRTGSPYRLRLGYLTSATFYSYAHLPGFEARRQSASYFGGYGAATE